LASAARSLAQDAAACAKRLVKTGTPVQFVLAGGVLLKQPRFARQLSQQLRRLWPEAIITPLKRESVWGAVQLAKTESHVSRFTLPVQRPQSKVAVAKSKIIPPPAPSLAAEALGKLASSPTEQRNPLSMNLDKLPLAEAIALMLREDAKIPTAVLAERKKIERAIRRIVRAFRRDGRLLYVGAGTSGRLGVLDASECPPTFRTAPDRVQGIIAGGQRALWEAVEGAEDDADAGACALQFREVSRRDVVVGIAASGRTPFVWGALEEARRRGAATVLLTCNPKLRIPRASQPNLVIAPDVGPEILTGSTRLKAGTATKLILNIFTTLAMVRWGKVLSNLMIDVKASNAKLRDRATRIVQELTKVDYQIARRALQRCHWRIKETCAQLNVKRNV
jgi:N-acetylmuramic acid 6-phosphate etherase